jgi:hypothetical protein
LVVAFQVGKDWSKLDAPSVQYTLMLEDGAWNGLSGKCDNPFRPSASLSLLLQTPDQVIWFCDVVCRTDFEDERHAHDSHREFARTGGWV